MKPYECPECGGEGQQARADLPCPVCSGTGLLPPTLRDRFAMAALIGQLACSAPIENREEPYTETAEIAYMLADEMLKARARPGAGAP